MCRHLEGKKIKFAEFFEHRYKGKPIYFYCEHCDKMFIAKIKDRKVNVIIYTLIIFDFVNSLLKTALYLPTAPLFLIALFFILSMQLLIDFIDWKFVKYEEVFIENLKS